MKKTLLTTLAIAVGVMGFAGTTPLSAAEPAPQSTDGSGAALRAGATTSLALGEIETVAQRRYQHRRYQHRRPHHRTNHRSRWCGHKGYYGKRCYYTPKVLRPFRQG